MSDTAGAGLDRTEYALLELAVAEAVAARAAGNEPFGSVLAEPGSDAVLAAQNTIVSDSDVTGHAELNLVRAASRRYHPRELAGHTLYTSTEPCAMCAGGIYWSGIGRVVFAVAGRTLAEFIGDDAADSGLDLPCRDVFATGPRRIEVIGPVPLDSAWAVHAGFWRPA